MLIYLPVRIEKIEGLVSHLLRSLHYVDIVHNYFGCDGPTLQNTLHGSFSKFIFLTNQLPIDMVVTKLNLHLRYELIVGGVICLRPSLVMTSISFL